MSVKSDLIAARALIDTPEKMAAMAQDPSPIFDAIHEACPSEMRFWNAREALLLASNARHLGATRNWPHAEVLALFDRAIAAA